MHNLLGLISLFGTHGLHFVDDQFWAGKNFRAAWACFSSGRLPLLKASYRSPENKKVLNYEGYG